MKNSIFSGKRLIIRAALPFLISSTVPMALATTDFAVENPSVTNRLEQRSKESYEEYIVGPGDMLEVKLENLPELSGRFPVGPDGNLYLPRLREVPAEGLTVKELNELLTEKFSYFVKYPEVYVRTVGYRPIRIYVGGEVQRPGYYTFKGFTDNVRIPLSERTLPSRDFPSVTLRQDITSPPSEVQFGASSFTIFPTVFDAIRLSQGITPYSDLTKVELTRKEPSSAGGGRIRTNLNFLSLITEGDESQNIRIFDGDVLTISKSNNVLREQILKARKSNLNPLFLQVFVSGRVLLPGAVNVPQGSGLNQAIALAGGTKFLKGKVEFVRFDSNGDVERRLFSYNRKAPIDSYKNPLLMPGDLIRVRNSLLSAASEVLNEVTAPAVGVYSLYNLFGGSK